MKYHQSDFTDELKETINNTELVLKDHIERLISKYKTVFAKKNMDVVALFESEGEDPFMPGYISSITIGISNEEDEFLTIKIWKCERFFIGLPTSKKLPGSKVIGELLDETMVEIMNELKEYINELLDQYP